MGEICIRNNLKGENTFFVNRFFNPELHVQYTKLLFNSSNTEICINGWVNYLDEKNYESILFLIEKIEDQQKYFNFNPQNINHLFRKIKENG